MSPEMKKAPIVVEHVGAEKRELSTDTSLGNPTGTPPSMSTASGSDPQNTVPHGRKQEIPSNFKSQVPPTHNNSTSTEKTSMSKKSVEATESASGPTSLTLDKVKIAVWSKRHDCKGGNGNSKAVFFCDITTCPLWHSRYECFNEYREKVRDDIQHMEYLNLKSAMREVPEEDFWTIWN